MRTLILTLAIVISGMLGQAQTKAKQTIVSTNHGDMTIVDGKTFYYIDFPELFDFGVFKADMEIEMPNDETRKYLTVFKDNRGIITFHKYSEIFDLFLMYGQYTLKFKDDLGNEYSITFFLEV